MANVDDVQHALDHAHNYVLCCIARLFSMKKVTPRGGPLNWCAGWKGMRKVFSTPTPWYAERRLQRLYTDRAGPMLKSAGKFKHWLMIFDNGINVGWVVVLLGKSVVTGTHVSRACLAGVLPKAGKCSSERRHGIHQRGIPNVEYASIDGPKRNGWVGHRLAP